MSVNRCEPQAIVERSALAFSLTESCAGNSVSPVLQPSAELDTASVRLSPSPRVVSIKSIELKKLACSSLMS